MINCFPTYIPLFLAPELRGNDVLWLVEEQHISLLQQLRFVHEKNVMPIPKGTLVNISAREVWFPMSSSSTDLLRACIPTFRLKVFENFHLPTLNFCESRSLLYIGRSEDRGRNVIGRERLLSHLAEAFPLLEIVYFWGNETMYEMAHLFSRAKIVIAPHGAAMANCIFYKEVNTFDAALLPHATDEALPVEIEEIAAAPGSPATPDAAIAVEPAHKMSSAECLDALQPLEWPKIMAQSAATEASFEGTLPATVFDSLSLQTYAIRTGHFFPLRNGYALCSSSSLRFLRIILNGKIPHHWKAVKSS